MKNCKNHEAPIKKNRFKIITAIIILISVIAGTVLSFSYISNGLKRAFMSSESYFKNIVRQNLKQDADRISLFISDLKENIILENQTEEKSLIISTKEEFSDIIGDFDFYKNINWLKDLKVNTKFTENEGLLQGSANLYINKKHITSLNCTADDSFSYVSIPPINDKLLITDLNNSPFKTGKILSSIPNKEILSEVITRYANILLENIEEVRENNEVININGIKEKCHKLSVKFEDETLKEILETLKTDKDIINALKIYSTSFSTAPEFEKIHDSFIYTLDKYIQNAEGAAENIIIELYVNGKGEIVGAGFFGENHKTEYLYIENGEKYGLKLTMQKSGGKSFTLAGGGTVQGKTASGKFTLSMETVEVLSIALQNVDIDKLNCGVFDGKINIGLSDNIKPLLDEALNNTADNIYLEIVSESNKNESNFKATLYNNDNPCVFLNLLSKNSEKTAIELPDEDDVKNAVDFSEWVNNFNLLTLAEKLTEAKVPLS